MGWLGPLLLSLSILINLNLDYALGSLDKFKIVVAWGSFLESLV